MTHEERAEVGKAITRLELVVGDMDREKQRIINVNEAHVQQLRGIKAILNRVLPEEASHDRAGG